MEEIGGKRKEITTAHERKFPQKYKVPPVGPESTLRLGQPNAKKTLVFTLSASADSRALEVTYSGKEKASEEYYGERLEARTKEGEVVSHFIGGFGVYGEEKTYELATPVDGVALLLRRSGDGDLSFWIKGTDLAKAESGEHESKKYLTVHKADGKVCGYTIKDFLHRVNLSFSTVLCQLQLE